MTPILPHAVLAFPVYSLHDRAVWDTILLECLLAENDD